MPGVEEITGTKCERLAERIAGKRSRSEGADWGKGKIVIFRMSKHSEMLPKVWAQRDEEVGFGIT